MSSISEDGTISMRSTGWEDECHWTGVHESKPSDPDHGFWKFVISIKERYEHFFDEKELEKLKEEYKSLKSRKE